MISTMNDTPVPSWNSGKSVHTLTQGKNLGSFNLGSGSWSSWFETQESLQFQLGSGSMSNNKQRISLIWNSREGTQGLPWYGSLLGVQKVMHHDGFIWRLKTSKNLLRVELVFSVLRSRSSNRQAIITWTLCLTYCFTQAKFPVVQNLKQLFNTWLNLSWTYMFYNHFWYIHCHTGFDNSKS